MKSSPLWIVAGPLLIVGGIAFWSLRAADKKETSPETPADAVTENPNRVFHSDFEDLEPGSIPSDYFVIEGEWSIAEFDGGKVLKLAETPLVDAQVQVGPSLKDEGGMVSARVKADKKRRSFPRFGVGMHGMSGYRLRLFPVQNRIELVRNEEVIQSADLDWRPEEWWHLELSVVPAGDAWTVSGRAWAGSGKRPEQALIEYIATEPKFSGKASLNGTAFAGLPIHFDDIEVQRFAKETNTPAGKAN